MRRFLGSVLVACVVLVGCTSSGDDVTDDEPSTDEPADTDESDSGDVDGDSGDGDSGSGDANEGSSGDPVTSTDGSTAEAGPPLPGLLDSSNEKILNDDSVRTGTLENGLRYYIRENDNPGGKADLRLVIRAGSVDEFGPTGAAHFVEHMLFNGTEQFPENELIDVLRSFGAAFGADVNAYTSFDETVYLLTVPSEEQSLQAGLNVLEQWLSHATFDAAQVDAERGVVLDEWRVRTQSSDGRLFDVVEQMYLTGTPYEGRSPIGTEDAIARVTDTELRQYYDTWYRPDNAAITVVGDIDVDEIEADIERLFGPATSRLASGQAAVNPQFAEPAGPAVGLHADPDQPTVDIEIGLPLPVFEGNGTAAWRAQLIDLIAYDALVRRLEQDAAAGTAPFDLVGPESSSFVESLDAPAVFASTDATRATDTIQALLDEHERVYRYGFSEDEVELAKSSLRSGYDTFYAGRDSAQDADYGDEYVDHFLTGSPYPTIAVEYETSIELLDAITAEAVDLRFAARWFNSAPHVIVSAPEADAALMPSEADVLALIAGLADRDIDQRDTQRELPDVLMGRPPSTSPLSIDEIVSSGDQFFDPIEITYPNGVRVILNTNTIVEGEVFFQAGSPGGSSLVADADVVDALYVADLVTASGVGDFNQAELEQILAGNDLELSAWLSPYRESFVGSAASADLEAMMQLLHLYMTQPRFDPVALAQLQSQYGPAVVDPGSSPGLAGDDALLDARYPGELRYAVLPTVEQFETLELAGAERVWSERFGNASDWVFVFSGDLDLDTATDLAGAYLGSLPGSQQEQWVDVEPPPPADIVEVGVEAGTGDTSSLALLYTSPLTDVDADLRVNADVVTEVIDARLTDVIREQNGDSYSPFAVSYVTTDPDPAIETYVSVTGSPDRIEAVADLVVAELADLASNGPSEQEFFNAYAQVEEAYNFVNNGEFITELLDDAIDPALELDDYLFEYNELANVSASSVRSYVAEHVPADQYIQVIVTPR